MRVASLTNSGNYSATHDVWVMQTSAIGDNVAAGNVLDVTNLVLLDRRLEWEGFLPAVRLFAALYKSRVRADCARARQGPRAKARFSGHLLASAPMINVVGTPAAMHAQVVNLPFSTYPYHLAYRRDLFQRYNLTVPSTWRELAQFAREKNGTAGMHAFCGLWGPCFQLHMVLIRSMMATYHQTQGSSQGWLFDPDTMRILVNTPAMEEILDILRVRRLASAVPARRRRRCPPPTWEGALGGAGP